MVRRTTEVTREVDELVYDIKVRTPPSRVGVVAATATVQIVHPQSPRSPSVQATDVGVQNALNEFNMLSNTQFIAWWRIAVENRVADDDDQAEPDPESHVQQHRTHGNHQSKLLA